MAAFAIISWVFIWIAMLSAESNPFLLKEAVLVGMLTAIMILIWIGLHIRAFRFSRFEETRSLIYQEMESYADQAIHSDYRLHPLEKHRALLIAEENHVRYWDSKDTRKRIRRALLKINTDLRAYITLLGAVAPVLLLLWALYVVYISLSAYIQMNNDGAQLLIGATLLLFATSVLLILACTVEPSIVSDTDDEIRDFLADWHGYCAKATGFHQFMLGNYRCANCGARFYGSTSYKYDVLCKLCNLQDRYRRRIRFIVALIVVTAAVSVIRYLFRQAPYGWAFLLMSLLFSGGLTWAFRRELARLFGGRPLWRNE